MKRGSGLLPILFIFLSIGHGQRVSQAAISNPQFNELLQRAAATHSDAVLVLKDGKPVAEYYSQAGKRKIELMSCTKSIVNFGIGRLIDQGKIKSLDQPVYEFYPEWKQGRKKLITIRHLLDQTSGLQNVRTTDVEIYPTPNFIKLALAAELETEPGKVFSYNNKAMNLLAGIIERASGKRMDIYFRDEIFKPMGIVDYKWLTDRAGNPQAMAGLQLTAADFAKFGELILNKGRWGSTRIVSEHWIQESMTPQAVPSYGLLWWLTPGDMDIVIDDEKFKEFEDAKVDPAFVKKLEPLRNKLMHSRQELAIAVGQALNAASPDSEIDQEIQSKGLNLAKFKVREVRAYSANGSLGQYMVICPKEKLVAVRQISYGKGYSKKTDEFRDFADLVQKICDSGLNVAVSDGHQPH
jgi:CubicO group peptidase (beta-lactamase class C family)